MAYVTLLVVFGGIVLLIILAYNKLVSLKNQTENAWSQIEVQLKRRHDLIPNLVSAVKGYMKHEKGVLERITELATVKASNIPKALLISISEEIETAKLAKKLRKEEALLNYITRD